MANSKSKKKKRTNPQTGAEASAANREGAAAVEGSADKASASAAAAVGKQAKTAKNAAAATGKDVTKKAEAKKDDSTKAVKKADTKKDVKKANKKPNVFKRLALYFHDVRTELKRVTWPTKAEVWRSSLVVVFALVFFGLLIFAIDSAVVPLLTLYSGLA